jgi:molecular chaperone GrpE
MSTENELQPEEILEETSATQTLANDEEYQALLAQSEEFKAALQRERADFTNYRKRVEREKGELKGQIVGDTVRSFLPIFDDLDRAINSLPSELKEHDWYKGFSLIGKKFNDLLESYGIQLIDPLGTPFDPNFHEAIGSDDSGEYASGSVSAVLQKGYALQGKCIRPAIVKVAN